ncbi:piezo-type mechanosensitive ion channel component 2 isoform X2 [Denticeps clupeoides]|uniref:piezo-type mechanosensitive ion channel component 2 isoform X2 n=1 Tax=Denticeps clupeoides TaxID=299321 RepID=UPI0010A34B46|nr:piezo-type mechanosensitive ion channel component 2-like isoform X2 [Denticeps clupeoides]
MASEVVCGLVFRLLLPVCLAAACLFRFNGLSFVYLIYLLLIPLFAEPTSTTMQGHTGKLLKSLCFTSMTFLLIHIIYQITVNSLLAREAIDPGFNCSAWEKSLRQIGFESVIGADGGNGIRVFIPDIGMFMAGLGTWFLCRSLGQKKAVEDLAQDNTEFELEEQDDEQEDGEKADLDDSMVFDEDFDAEDEAEDEEYVGDEEEEEEEVKESMKMKILRHIATVASKVKEVIGNLITTAGKVVVTILLGLTGIMLPSLTSAVYFMVFLGLCTWWSICRTFNTLLFSCMCVLLAIFSAGHLIVLYLYQFQFFQETAPPDNITSLFGISPIIQTNCSHTWKLTVNPHLKWFHFVNPIMLLVLYYTLATLIRLWLQDPTITEEGEDVDEGEDAGGNAADRRRQLWWRAHQKTEERNAVVVTSNGTSFQYVAPLNAENGPRALDLYSTPQYKVDQSNGVSEKKESSVYEVVEVQEEEEEEEDNEEERHSSRPNAVVKVFRFIMKQSYICALIAMMAWSITYVSWLTFVFLIWSCILWMVRDRRRYAMISSPFMVAYGNLLLMLQYIFSFENQKEVAGLFPKQEDPVPFSELGTKILCLQTFWLLLHQTLTERQDKLKEEAALSEVKVETPQTEEKDEGDEGDENDITHMLGNLVMAMLVKYWIYICGGMFFFVSFQGRMVMYKIIYMMLFLFCVALYQVHYEWWRKILKYFWLSVVVYTMLVLILVYTFQFKSSLPIWSDMTGMSEEKLKDLGLEQFSVSELFTRIFIPTSFLLVCNIHLHYFHERFLQLTDLKAVVAKEESTIYRLVDQDGSLADITMMSSSSDAAPHKEEEREEKMDRDQEVLVVDGVGLQKQKEGSDLLSSQEGSLPCSLATEAEPTTEQSSDLKSKWHLVVDRLTVLFLKFLEYFHKLQVFIWWLLEIHIIKIVSSYIILVTVREVSLFNYVFLALWAFALPYSQFRHLTSSICSVWTCVIINCKMLYQLEFINPENFSINCTMPINPDIKDLTESKLYKKPIDPSEWVGLSKLELPMDLMNNLLILAILAFEVTIYRHQEYYRLHNKLSPPPSRTIFHSITRQHLDNGIVDCAKYFINYFFYKFGLEVCFLLAVNVIGQRMDFYAMLHAFGLIAVMFRRRRKAIAEIWPKYCCFLACMLTFQYFVCIGIPPAACKDYPWRFLNSGVDSNVIKWLYLPDFLTNPKPTFLIYDFMLLLCASQQRQVFDEENQAAVRLMAGDNVEICRDLDAASFSVHNPVPDFIHCRSYLDMLKVIMFSYLFWFVLTIIFITGTTRISIFCMGYLVACFYFLLFGGNLLLKPIKKILHYWDFLIAYNIFVITMKNILSILACGYIQTLAKKQCWLIQLFSLACTIKEYTIITTEKNDCDLPSDEAGIIWDSICFAFLLLQRRVFMSYYFLHVVADIRASQILASRGAELFQATIVKAVRARLEEERKSMEQLKRQMDRIKNRQQKFKRGKEKMLSITQESGDGVNLMPPEQEEDDDGAEKEKAKSKKKQWWRPWVDHASMVRSGDYYLFETDSEEEEEEEEKKEEEAPKKSALQRAIGKFASAVLALPRSIIKLPKVILQYIIRAAKFLYHAWATDSKTAMKERSKGKRRFWKRYGRGKHRRDKKEGQVAIEVGEQESEQDGDEEGKKSAGQDNIIKRVFNIIKFTWVLFLTTMDSTTVWLNSMCREYIDISTVLRIERCMLTREVKKGNVPSREGIQVYYQKQLRRAMSRDSADGLLSEEDSLSHRARRRRAAYRMESQDSRDSMVSRDSISSAYTEATMLFSRQSTLDDLDVMPENIPKTSQRARPKLHKMYSLDMSNSSADSESSAISSEATQCFTLYSRQGTNDTIEEVEDERDQGEAVHHREGADGPSEAEGTEMLEGLEAGSGTQHAEGEEGMETSAWEGGELGEMSDDLPEAQWEGVELQEEAQHPRDEKETTEYHSRLQDGESSDPEYLQVDGGHTQVFTPDTDVPNISDADVPPSYSKAVSFDRLSVSTDESDDNKRLMIMTPDSRSDLDDSLLPTDVTTELTASELLLNKMFHDEELEASDHFYKGQPQLLQLCYALYNMLVAHSEMVCYFVIILNHLISAYIATLVLPILIFLWAMLSVPRPSKRFWMTAIVYTEVTIVVKYFFQFSFFPFNQHLNLNKNKPYHPPNIIGVEKKDGYVHYDLVQLLMLFFHRSILKCHGLWDEDDPKKPLQRDTGVHHDESEDEEKTPSVKTSNERGSMPSLASANMGNSIDVAPVLVHVRYPEQCTYHRRKSSSGASHVSRRSSVRSKRGSTSTHNGSRRGGSEAEVQQKSRKEMILEKLKEQLIKAKVFLMKKMLEIYMPIRQFFYNLIHPEYNAVTDVYVLMFLADTVDFIIIVFGFWAFGKHSAAADITSSLSEDQVPGAFLVMVLIQFGTMVVDRALYLKKTVMGKVIFQVILVFGIHFWMFFILPGVTDRRFSDNTVAQIWYFVKCVYFGLSAYQIRCGYPTRVLGNFLTKSYNYVNLFLFQGFRLVPFLTELRAVMDWVWTDTTLSLSSWICVEDIYAHIFVLKCWRESEKRYPQPRGQKKKKVVKYGMGGMIVFLLICIVWFPLLFMSLVKSVAGVVNKPLDVSVSITLGGFQPIFTMSAQQQYLVTFTEKNFTAFLKARSSDSEAMQFLEAYTFEDVTIAKLEGSSNSLWTISPPSRDSLKNMLDNHDQSFTITFSWSIQRNLSLGAKAEIAVGKHSIDLDNETKSHLSGLINGSKDAVNIGNIFPQYIRAPSDSNSKPIDQLYGEDKFMNITLSLRRSGSTKSGNITQIQHSKKSEQESEWWVVNQVVERSKGKNDSGLELYVFSDQVSPPSLGFLAGYGIMGLYASVVLVIGKFVREFFSGISHTIMFEELPNVDRILKLCTDIFLVRETGALDLEEDLYAKLIFLYRSPETMIKWTREKTQ